MITDINHEITDLRKEVNTLKNQFNLITDYINMYKIGVIKTEIELIEKIKEILKID